MQRQHHQSHPPEMILLLLLLHLVMHAIKPASFIYYQSTNSNQFLEKKSSELSSWWSWWRASLQVRCSRAQNLVILVQSKELSFIINFLFICCLYSSKQIDQFKNSNFTSSHEETKKSEYWVWLSIYHFITGWRARCDQQDLVCLHVQHDHDE